MSIMSSSLVSGAISWWLTVCCESWVTASRALLEVVVIALTSLERSASVIISSTEESSVSVDGSVWALLDSFLSVVTSPDSSCWL